MRNHTDKQRDMARSVLPSTARKGARWARRHSHKTARQAIRATLHNVRTAEHPDDVDAPLDRYRIDQGRTTSDYFDEWLVGARRSADKIGPLIRWADAIINRTPELRDGDYWSRRNHFSAILPDTLQGRHALSHIEHLFGPRGAPRWDFSDRDRRRSDRHEAAMARFHSRQSKLHDVLRIADTRRLNDRIAALTPPNKVVEQRISTERTWAVRPVSVSVVPWLFDGDADRWLGKPYLRHGWPTEPLEGSTEAKIAHQALGEAHTEMFPSRPAQ